MNIWFLQNHGISYLFEQLFASEKVLCPVRLVLVRFSLVWFSELCIWLVSGCNGLMVMIDRALSNSRHS